VRFSDKLSSPLVVLSGVLQGSVLGPLLSNNFINDLCDVINHSDCLLFADDLKVYRSINSPSDCLLLQSDIDCVYAWCSANFMKPNSVKLELFLLLRKRTSQTTNTDLEFFLYFELIVLRI
jgi:hypothetical protein